MILYPDQIAQELKQRSRRRFIVPGMLPAGPTLFYGDSGSGKTGIAIATAVAVAADLQFAGGPVAQGCVLYIAGEDYEGVKERILAAVRERDLDEATVSLAVMEAPAEGLVSKNFVRDVQQAVEKMVKDADIKVALIIVDTLSACFGNESQDDARPASIVMNALDRLARDNKCAVLAVHHTGKTGSEMRGSQVLFDRADAVVKVSRKDGGSTFMEVRKMRSGPSGQRFAFDIGALDLDAADGSISVQIVRNVRSLKEASSPIADPSIRQQTDADVAAGILHRLLQAGPVKANDWRDACYAAWSGKNDNARRKAFSTVRKKLTSDNLIEHDGDFVTVTTPEIPVTLPVATKPVTVTATAPPLKRGADGNKGRPLERRSA